MGAFFRRFKLSIFFVLVVAYLGVCTLGVNWYDHKLYHVGNAVSSTLLLAMIAGLICTMRSPGPSHYRTPGGGTATPDPLLLLRGLTCVMVFLGHYFGVVYAPAELSALLAEGSLYSYLLSAPWAAVWIFFVLSGYLMGKGFFSGRYTLDEGGIGRFMRNRALRVLPVYLAAVIITAVLVTPQIFLSRNIWMQLSYLSFNFKGDLAYNPIGALWTISTEVHFYLLSPFMAMALNRLCRYTGTLPLLMVTLLAGLALRVWGYTHFFPAYFHNFLFTTFVANLDIFLLGMLLAKLRCEAKNALPLWLSARGVTLGLLLFAAGYAALNRLCVHTIYANVETLRFYAYTPTAACLFAMALIALFEAGRPHLLAPGNRASRTVVARLQGLGTLAYCIYVMHSPILMQLRHIFPATLEANEVLIYFLPISLLVLIVSLGFYHFIEKPYEHKKQ